MRYISLPPQHFLLNLLPYMQFQTTSRLPLHSLKRYFWHPNTADAAVLGLDSVKFYFPGLFCFQILFPGFAVLSQMLALSNGRSTLHFATGPVKSLAYHIPLGRPLPHGCFARPRQLARPMDVPSKFYAFAKAAVSEPMFPYPGITLFSWYSLV